MSEREREREIERERGRKGGRERERERERESTMNAWGGECDEVWVMGVGACVIVGVNV